MTSIHQRLRQGLSVVAISSLALFTCGLSAADWPQWLGPQRDGVWRESGIVETLPTNGLKFRWRTPIGSGYSGPAVVNGRVFVMDRQIAAGAKNPPNAFARGEIPGTERVLCLNEADGKILWQHEYDSAYTVSYASGPRVTPAVADGKVYTLGSEGNLLCLDTAEGKVLWSHDFKKDFGIKTPVWGFAGHPLVDGQEIDLPRRRARQRCRGLRQGHGQGTLARAQREGAGLRAADDLRVWREAAAHHLASRSRERARSRKPAKLFGAIRSHLPSAPA